MPPTMTPGSMSCDFGAGGAGGGGGVVSVGGWVVAVVVSSALDDEDASASPEARPSSAHTASTPTTTARVPRFTLQV
jgi:hypothetical protein